MKRVLAAILVAIMTSCAFTACNNSEQNSSTADHSGSTAPSVSETQSEASDEEKDPYEHLRDIDLGEKEIVIYVEDQSSARYYSQEIMPNDLSPDLISSAVASRNQIVEDLLNCHITEVRTRADGEMRNNIYAEMMGASSYDIVMPYMPAAASLAAEGAFYDLTSFDVINLDRSYWDQRANADLSIAGKLFFSTGDFSLLTFDCTHAIVFNKDVVNSNPDIENPYTLLADGKWTLDETRNLPPMKATARTVSPGATTGAFMSTVTTRPQCLSAQENVSLVRTVMIFLISPLKQTVQPRLSARFTKSIPIKRRQCRLSR